MNKSDATNAEIFDGLWRNPRLEADWRRIRAAYFLGWKGSGDWRVRVYRQGRWPRSIGFCKKRHRLLAISDAVMRAPRCGRDAALVALACFASTGNGTGFVWRARMRSGLLAARVIGGEEMAEELARILADVEGASFNFVVNADADSYIRIPRPGPPWWPITKVMQVRVRDEGVTREWVSYPLASRDSPA